MNNKTNGECETKLCNYSITRTRFYNGMLLTDEHLRAEQQYYRNALRRLTRHLFGWGVVCGLDVRVKRGLCIEVDPGVGIDCCGNLIEVCKCITIDLSKECEKLYPSDCVPQDPPVPFTKYLVLRFMEKETDPEPVLTPSDDCASPEDKPGCQHSKIREGYCLELWDKCPCGEAEPDDRGLRAALKASIEQYEQKAQATQLGQQQQQQARAAELKHRGQGILELPRCSPCGCCEDALGLADLKIDCENKTVEIQDTCRRDVISPRFLDAVWFKVRNAATRQMAKLHSRFAYPATANIVASAIEYEEPERLKIFEDRMEGFRRVEERVEELRRLEGRVEELRKLEERVEGFRKLEERVEGLRKLETQVAELGTLKKEIEELRKGMAKAEKAAKKQGLPPTEKTP